ncbi:MAG TPA: hypothetical protein VGH88_07170 [Streptosporangiaceae bacterium]|jgi:hypothetical protein
MIRNADEFGTTIEENTLRTYVISFGQDRPSAAVPQPTLYLTGTRVPT